MVSISSNDVALREEDRQRLAADVEAYLASGKRIRQISHGTQQKEIRNQQSINGEKQRSRIRSKKINRAIFKYLKAGDPEKLLNREQVMELTGLSKSAVNHWSNGTSLVEVCRPFTLRPPHQWRAADLVNWCENCFQTAKG